MDRGSSFRSRHSSPVRARTIDSILDPGRQGAESRRPSLRSPGNHSTLGHTVMQQLPWNRTSSDTTNKSGKLLVMAGGSHLERHRSSSANRVDGARRRQSPAIQRSVSVGFNARRAERRRKEDIERTKFGTFRPVSPAEQTLERSNVMGARKGQLLGSTRADDSLRAYRAISPSYRAISPSYRAISPNYRRRPKSPDLASFTSKHSSTVERRHAFGQNMRAQSPVEITNRSSVSPSLYSRRSPSRRLTSPTHFSRGRSPHTSPIRPGRSTPRLQPGSPPGSFVTHDLTQTKRIQHRSMSPVVQYRVHSPHEATTPRSVTEDETRRSLHSLRKMRQDRENMHERPTRTPLIRSSPVRSSSTGTAPGGSVQTPRESANGAGVGHIDRWLKDVSAALEREQETIRVGRAQQMADHDSTHQAAGYPQQLHQEVDGALAARRLEGNQAERTVMRRHRSPPSSPVLKDVTGARLELESTHTVSMARTLGKVRAQNQRWRARVSPGPLRVAA